MRIGEKMSELTDLDAIVEDPLGEYYENSVAALVQKPLDVGRQVYARLRQAIPEEADLEVWWDHRMAQIEVEVHVGEATITTTIEEQWFATSRLIFIEQIKYFVKRFTAEVQEWQA